MPDSSVDRPANWRWRVTLILMLALVLNYSNRLVFSQNAVQIQHELSTDEHGYGQLAGRFSLGFAWGGLIFGILADWISVRWLYPVVMLVWSAAGMSRGWVTTFDGMAYSQFVMGLFMAGHWPCALRTTQRLFDPTQRTLGNAVLQSGASVGNILTPLLVVGLLWWDPARWRWGFEIVGVIGLVWVVIWLRTVSEADLRRPVLQTASGGTAGIEVAVNVQERPLWQLLFSVRWCLLLVTVIAINSIWHYVTTWMPLTMEKDHHYSKAFVQYFTALYYLGTFVAGLITGWLTARLPAMGWSITRSRLTIFGVCSLLTACAIPAAFLPKGTGMLTCFMLVSFGSLGLFPVYYSLNQELSARHQGKVGGILSFVSWGLLSQIHPAVGKLVTADPHWRPWIFASFGIAPLIALVLLTLFWRTATPVATPEKAT